MIGSVSSSTAQQLYSTTQTSPAKSAPAAKPSKPASEEATESGAEKSAELSKGEKIDTYA